MDNLDYKPEWKRAYGIVVKELREQLGLGRAEFEKRAALSKGYLNHLEDRGTPIEPRGEIYRQIAKALNLTPEELYKRFKQKQNELKRATESATLKTQAFSLPPKIAPVRNWVGRTQELDILKSQLLDSNTRAITITSICVVGLAGIGKTTLASKLVRELQVENSPFVTAAWESLRSVTGKPPRFDNVIDSLLLTLSNGKITQRDLISDNYFLKTERLLELLKKRPSLVVLDNVETVLKTGQARQAGYFDENYAEYAWLFQQLVEIDHNSKIIFTSREALAQLIKRETYNLKLQGLDVDASILLLESFELDAGKEELTTLATRYAGHPKALEVVAAVIIEDFQGQVGKFLQDQKWLLIRDIESLIDEVIKRLSKEEYACLSQISVYQTEEYPLNHKGIAAQMPDVEERDLRENIILALKRRQLLDFNSDSGSYQMHPLVQEKASYLLDSLTSNSAHQKAYLYFLNLVKPEVEWKEFNDIKPLVRAYHHACKAEEWDRAAEVALRIFDFLRTCSNFEIILDLYCELLPEDWKQGNQIITSAELHADILFSLGYACAFLRDSNAAYEYLEQSLILSRRIRDQKRIAKALCYLGLTNLDNPDLACRYLQESLDLSTKINDEIIKYRSLEYLGCAYTNIGDMQTTLNYFNQSLEVAQKAGFQEGEAIALGNIGNVYRTMEDYETSIRYTKQYYEVACRVGNVKYIEYALNCLSEEHNSIGDYHNAVKYGEECLKAARDSFDKIIEIWAMSNIGIACRGLGEHQKAINTFKRCLEIARKIKCKENEAGALYNLGVTYRMAHQIQDSIDAFENSLAIYDEANYHMRKALVLLEMAKVYRQSQSQELASLRYLAQAEEICVQLELPLLTEVQKIKAELSLID